MKKKMPLIHFLLKITGIVTMVLLSISNAAHSQIITTVAGNNAMGPGVSGDGGQATLAELAYPTFVIAGGPSAADDSIYITVGNKIRGVNLGTGVIKDIAGNGFLPGSFSGDGGNATAAELYEPNGMCLNKTGELLFIADMLNNRIRRVQLTNGIITTVAGNGAYGWSGDGGEATAAELASPTSIAQDYTSGDYYITELGNNAIRKVTVVGTSHIISTIAGGNISSGYSGDGGPAINAELCAPWCVSVDQGNENIFIADEGNEVIREIVYSSSKIYTYAGIYNTFNYSGDGGPATNAELNYPYAVSAEADHIIYIADVENDRIREVNSSGTISTFAGNGYGAPLSGGFSGDGGAATLAELWWPQGVFADGNGNCYIADRDNYVVRHVTLTPNVSTGADDLNNSASGISVFPNPTRGVFQVSGLKSGYRIEIYNYLGQLINGYKTNIGDLLNINISGQTSGIYFLRIISDTGIPVGNKKIIKIE